MKATCKACGKGEIYREVEVTVLTPYRGSRRAKTYRRSFDGDGEKVANHG